MPSEQQTARELESIDVEGVQAIVRAFRQALDRGERPASEAYVPEETGNRRAALIELIPEEMEVRIKGGESFSLDAHLDRFDDLLADPGALRELFVAEADVCRRVTAAGREDPAGAVERQGSTARPQVRIGRYELGDVTERRSGAAQVGWCHPLRPRYRVPEGDGQGTCASLCQCGRSRGRVGGATSGASRWSLARWAGLALENLARTAEAANADQQSQVYECRAHALEPERSSRISPSSIAESKLRSLGFASPGTYKAGLLGEIHRPTAETRITATHASSMTVSPMLSQPRTTSPALIMLRNLPVIS